MDGHHTPAGGWCGRWCLRLVLGTAGQAPKVLLRAVGRAYQGGHCLCMLDRTPQNNCSLGCTQHSQQPPPLLRPIHLSSGARCSQEDTWGDQELSGCPQGWNSPQELTWGSASPDQATLATSQRLSPLGLWGSAGVRTSWVPTCVWGCCEDQQGVSEGAPRLPQGGTELLLGM